MVGVLLMGSGVAFCYRSGRYDPITILVFVCLAAFVLQEKSRFRLLMIFILSALSPWAGVNLATYLVLLVGMMLCFNFRARWNDAVLIVSGMAVGTASLLALYASQGVLAGFYNSLFPHVATATTAPLKKCINALTADPSAALLILALAIIFARQGLKTRVLWKFGFGFAFFIPVAMVLLGKFPNYYSWMSYIPLAVIVFYSVDRYQQMSSKGFRCLLACVIGAASAIGLPARLSVAVLEREARDYRPVDDIIDKYVTSADVVYSDPQAYYAVKRIGARAHFLYRDVLSKDEKFKVNLVILELPDNVNLASEFGGNWEKVGELKPVEKVPFPNLTARKYGFSIFRREI